MNRDQRQGDLRNFLALAPKHRQAAHARAAIARLEGNLQKGSGNE